MEKKYTAGDLLAALALKHSDTEGWAFFSEFATRTGVAGPEAHRNLDALVVGLWHENSGSIGYEIKVSRADFLKDVTMFDAKQGPALEFCTQFYYAVPLGLVEVNEVPEVAGLMALDERGAFRVLKVAPRREITTVPFQIFRSMARRTADPNKKVIFADFLKKCVGVPEITFEMLDEYIQTRTRKQMNFLTQEVRRARERNWERSVSEAMLSRLLSAVQSMTPGIGDLSSHDITTDEGKAELTRIIVDHVDKARTIRMLKAQIIESAQSILEEFNDEEGETDVVGGRLE